MTSNFATRVKQLREKQGLSQVKFAQKIEAKTGQVRSTESGRSIPGVDFAVKIVRAFPNVSLKWLLLCEGSMEEEGEGIERSEAGERETRLSSIIQNLSLVASRGGSLDAWQVSKLLASSHPESLRIQDIAKSFPKLPSRDLEAVIALLSAQGVILERGGEYLHNSESGTLKDFGLAESSECGLEAVRALLEDILPSVSPPPSRGNLINAFLSVPKGDGQRLKKEITSFVRERCKQFRRPSGSDEVIIVLGVTVTSKQI